VPPAGWGVGEERSPDGMLLLQITPPSGLGAVVQDVWSGFLPEVPDARVTQSYEVVLDGARASVIDDASPSVAGTIVVGVGGHLVAGGTAYAFTATLAGDTLTFVTDDARYELRRAR